MKINTSIFEPLRPERSAPVDSATTGRAGDPAKASTAAAPAAGRRDSVQISDSARALAAKADAAGTEPIQPERVAELRRKVYEGAYNTLDVVDQVARRVLSRGDV